MPGGLQKGSVLDHSHAFTGGDWPHRPDAMARHRSGRSHGIRVRFVHRTYRWLTLLSVCVVLALCYQARDVGASTSGSGSGLQATSVCRGDKYLCSQITNQHQCTASYCVWSDGNPEADKNSIANLTTTTTSTTTTTAPNPTTIPEADETSEADDDPETDDDHEANGDPEPRDQMNSPGMSWLRSVPHPTCRSTSSRLAIGGTATLCS